MKQASLTAVSLALALLLACPSVLFAGGRALIPMEKESALDALPIGGPDASKAKPAAERVEIRKEDIGASGLMGKKDPLVMIAEPRAGLVHRAYQKVSGRVGGGITKAFLRINEDTQVVTVSGGAFETYAALKPGLNGITAMAWDLDGNLGKDDLKVFYKPTAEGPSVEVTSPADGMDVDMTGGRVITVVAKAGPDIREGVLVQNNIPRKVGFERGVMRQDLALLPGTNEIFVEVEDAGGRAGRSKAVRVYTFDARPKDLVAALYWDSPTADLDLHAWDSFGHHTFADAPDAHLSEAAIPSGMLDMDKKGGYGPEVFSLEYAEPEVYTFYAKYNPGIKDGGAWAYLKLLLHGDEPSRRIMRSFGPVYLGHDREVWEAAYVKMPEGVFFQEKDSDLARTLGMDARAVKRLALILEEENPSFKLLAVSAMGQIKSEDAVPSLLKALKGSPPEVRRAAAGALWNIKSVKSVEGLARALRDDDPEVRRTAAGALGNIGVRSALGSLTGLLAEESDLDVRVEIIRAIGRMSDPLALGSLMPQAKDPDPRVRAETMRALGNIRDPKAEASLKEALDDKEEGVREVAAWSLGRLSVKTAAKALMDALRFDLDEGVRVQAAVALGALKDDAALEELGHAAERDGSEKVRFCARKAMDGITAPREKDPELPPIQLDEDVMIY